MTQPPTLSPIDCDFAFVSVNDSVLSSNYNGDYSQDTVTQSDGGKLSWSLRSDSSVVIFYSEPFWYLGSVDTSDTSSLIVKYDSYKPPDSALWQLNEIEIVPETTEANESYISTTNMPDMPEETSVVGDYVLVDFDCGISIDPTSFPTNQPSSMPTPAPISGMYFVLFCFESVFCVFGSV